MKKISMQLRNNYTISEYESSCNRIYGFIGKALCQKLLKNGYEVLGVDPYVNKLEDEILNFLKVLFQI